MTQKNALCGVRRTHVFLCLDTGHYQKVFQSHPCDVGTYVRRFHCGRSGSLWFCSSPWTELAAHLSAGTSLIPVWHGECVGWDGLMMSGQQFCHCHSQSAYKATNHQSTLCRLSSPLMLNIIVVSCRSSDSHFPLTAYSFSCYNGKEWRSADTVAHTFPHTLPHIQLYSAHFKAAYGPFWNLCPWLMNLSTTLWPRGACK